MELGVGHVGGQIVPLLAATDFCCPLDHLLSLSSSRLSFLPLSLFILDNWTGIQMEPNRRPPSLNLSSSSPARPVSTSPSPSYRQSQSPFRYIQFDQDINDIDEKATPLNDLARNDRKRQLSPGPSARQQKVKSPQHLGHLSLDYQPRTARPQTVSPSPQLHSPFLRQHALSTGPIRVQSQTSYTRPRGLRMSNLLRPWIPLIMYGITTLAFVVAIAIYRDDVFSCAWLYNHKPNTAIWILNILQVLTNCLIGCKAMSCLAMQSFSFSFS